MRKFWNIAEPSFAKMEGVRALQVYWKHEDFGFIFWHVVPMCACGFLQTFSILEYVFRTGCG